MTREELAERMAQVFKARYVELVRKVGHEEAYEAASKAMRREMKALRRRLS